MNNYQCKTNIKSIHQICWVTYEVLSICPEAQVNFHVGEPNSPLTIVNSNLSDSQIESILIDHHIDFEKTHST